MTANKVTPESIAQAIEKGIGRPLTAAERPIVLKALAAPLARIEAGLAAIEAAQEAKLAKRRVTPEFAKAMLELEERVSNAEIAKGLRPVRMAETHPSEYAALRKIVGDPVKKNGAAGAPTANWAKGIL